MSSGYHLHSLFLQLRQNFGVKTRSSQVLLWLSTAGVDNPHVPTLLFPHSRGERLTDTPAKTGLPIWEPHGTGNQELWSEAPSGCSAGRKSLTAFGEAFQ